MSKKQQRKSFRQSAALTIPELEQSKAAILNTLASPHSRRSYEYAIERFIAWYCDEPRLALTVPSWCAIARFWKVFPCRPLRSIVSVWPTHMFDRRGLC